MRHDPIPRIDKLDKKERTKLLNQCRLAIGEVWHDPKGLHTVAVGDAVDTSFIKSLFGNKRAALAVQDPPYNLVMFEKRSVPEFIAWCQKWLDNCHAIMHDNSSLYVWLGADQNKHFEPLPQFMSLMAASDFESRSFITMRNQRGYGTQKNWMAVRQELLYYTLSNPVFHTQYTDIPKILRGYYKEVAGEMTENSERGRSEFIRPGNVWVDIQQVFYRMKENVTGCYAQKPLKAILRIIEASSNKGDIVTDFFAHSGATLLAAEMTGRRCVTFDIDPIYAEITIRRLEHYRQTGECGWQAANAFAISTGLSNRVKETKTDRLTAVDSVR